MSRLQNCVTKLRRAISEMKNAGQAETAREAIQSSSLEASEKETLLGQLD